MDDGLSSIDEKIKDYDEQFKKIEGIASVDLEDSDVNLLYEMGYNFYLSSDYKNSGVVFKRLVLSRPFEVRFWKSLAASHQMSKEHEEALSGWGICSFLDSKEASYHFHAGESLLALHRIREAFLELDKAKSLDESGSLSEQIDLLRECWQRELEQDDTKN